MASATSVTEVVVLGASKVSRALCRGYPCETKTDIDGVALRQVGSWICVGVPGRGKLWTSFGWIPASRWHPFNNHFQQASRWIGVWQNESAKITVRGADAGKLSISGHAVRELGPGRAPIYGDFSTVSLLKNDAVTGPGNDYGCQVAIRLVGDFIVAIDNYQCGGIDATFDGMYRLRHH